MNHHLFNKMKSPLNIDALSYKVIFVEGILKTRLHYKTMMKVFIFLGGCLDLGIFCTNGIIVIRRLLKNVYYNMKNITCKKLFPTINSLNTHITAVHDNLKLKPKLEKEPSLKMRKMHRAT